MMQLYPHVAGAKTEGTSREAAQEMTGRAGTLRGEVLALLKKAPHFTQGLTADEAARLLGESVLAVRPRFSELLALGEIRDIGEVRKNASGRNATVWIANLRGMQLGLFQ